jgi:hypothetical protein
VTNFYLKKKDLESKSIYTCLFEKILDLESKIDYDYVFYYLYDNSIPVGLSHFKIPLRKIESIEISFFYLIFFN